MCPGSTSSLRRPGRRRARNCLCRRPKCFEKSRRKRETRKYSSINIHVSHGSTCHSCSVCSKSEETVSKDSSKIDAVGNNEKVENKVEEAKNLAEESKNDDTREFDIKVVEQPRSDDVAESNFPPKEIKDENVTDKETLDAEASFQQLEVESPDRNSVVYERGIKKSNKYKNDYALPHVPRSPSLNNYLPSESSDSSVTNSSSEVSASKKNRPHRRSLNTISNKIKRQSSRKIDVKFYDGNGTVNESYLISETEMETTEGSDQAENFSPTPSISNRFRNSNPMASEISRSIFPRNFSRNSSMQSRRSVHFHPQSINPHEYSGFHRIAYQRIPRYEFEKLRLQTPCVPARNYSQYKSRVYSRSPNTSIHSYNYANPRVSENLSQHPRQVPVRNQCNHPRSSCCENPCKYRHWNGRALTGSRPSPMSIIISSGQSKSWTAIPESREQPTNPGLTRSSHTLMEKCGERRLPSVEDLGSDDSLPEYASEADDLDSDPQQESSRDMHDSWPDKRRERQRDSFMASTIGSEGSKTITRNRREYSWHANENSNSSNMHRPWTTRVWEEVTYVKK